MVKDEAGRDQRDSSCYRVGKLYGGDSGGGREEAFHVHNVSSHKHYVVTASQHYPL